MNEKNTCWIITRICCLFAACHCYCKRLVWAWESQYWTPATSYSIRSRDAQMGGQTANQTDNSTESECTFVRIMYGCLYEITRLYFTQKLCFEQEKKSISLKAQCLLDRYSYFVCSIYCHKYIHVCTFFIRYLMNMCLFEAVGHPSTRITITWFNCCRLS